MEVWLYVSIGCWDDGDASCDVSCDVWLDCRYLEGALPLIDKNKLDYNPHSPCGQCNVAAAQTRAPTGHTTVLCGELLYYMVNWPY